jgi:2-polyprenyl-3-methyl-5-hydroxy-6-metoxy-1,4-benzoquinol methylase
MLQTQSDADYYQHQKLLGKIVEAVSSHVRKQMFNVFMKAVRPDSETRVVDVGVSTYARGASNFFEALYPYSYRITAVGLSGTSYLVEKYPGLTYLSTNALSLPFEDESFDVAVSWAVIEHIGSRERQRAFIRELSRVSKVFVIATPNRWYPIEFHTVLPLLHWLPPQTFRNTLKTLRMPFYASEETLNLLDEKALQTLMPEGISSKCFYIRLMGMVSNLLVCGSRYEGSIHGVGWASMLRQAKKKLGCVVEHEKICFQ